MVHCSTMSNSKEKVKDNSYSSKKYEEMYRRSIDEPEEFWAEIGKQVTWTKPWDQVLDNSNQPFTKWYVGGELNACYNAVDRHVEAGKGSKVALIHDSPLTNTIRKVTFDELLDQVSRLAGALAKLGVTKGDRVVIYMPLIPEGAMAMLATVRLGAVHSVIFGGYAARDLAVKMEHTQPKIVIAASCGIEPHRLVKYKEILNEAIQLSAFKPKKCIIFQRSSLELCDIDPEIDVLWEDALKMGEPHCCVSVEANEPLYILYTSGTTGQPKGVQRPVGGHIATLAWSMKTIYGMTEDGTWWATSDLGWVVGHSYICYGPLLAGITSVMYEGKPDRTPDPGQYFRIIDEHKVTGLFSVPTAFRVIKMVDPEASYAKKYSIDSLVNIFFGGEHFDSETRAWTVKLFGKPVFNHWWQTETGHSITTHCVGLDASVNPPEGTTGMAFAGHEIHIFLEDGKEAACGELGRICVKLPLPPGTLTTLYKSPDRFREIYFSKYPGFYDTMDAGYRDEFGYIYVTARDDDVINVAGHRLCTAAIEDVIFKHPDICDAAVVGVPDAVKGEVPMCIFVITQSSKKDELTIRKELVKMVRESIGPVAAFQLALAVKALPRTRSGKTCRKSISDLSRNKLVKISGRVEDITIYTDIKAALQKLGFALTAPDVQ